MSRHFSAMEADTSSDLGTFLRELRKSRDLALWQVAAEARMDSTLLSKIELGDRLPTTEQSALLARFFGVPLREIERRRIVAKFWLENGDNPAVGEAVQALQETAPAYVVNKSVNKSRKTSR